MVSHPVALKANVPVLSVSELNRQAKQLLEVNFSHIYVQGELSTLTQSRAGHWYFTLKDEQAQVRCVLFRQRNQRLTFTPVVGMCVQARAQVSLYTDRGDYQLIVEHLVAAGTGALQQAFAALKQQLVAEGLFDQARKQPLPAYPQHIGVITSPTGAVIRDILAVLKRRAPAIPVTIIASAVQGEEAVPQLVQALDTAAHCHTFDVLIIGRGGGSLEDLWPFNSERVARAIAHCRLPIVSAVGHETDFTIADFVADCRASTPSAAAEILSPDGDALLERTQLLHNKLRTFVGHQLQRARYRLANTSQRLKHPGDQLHALQQKRADLATRLHRVIYRQVEQQQARLHQRQYQLHQQAPSVQITAWWSRLHYLSQQLSHGCTQHLAQQQSQLRNLSGRLHAISPLATLARGYAILHKAGQVITQASGLAPGDQVIAQLHQGQAQLLVQHIHSANE